MSYVIYRIVSLRSSEGKTTVGVLLVDELRRLGVSVGVVKHSVHGVDVADKDSAKYMAQGPSYVVVASKDEVGVFRKGLGDDLKEVLKELPPKPTVIIVEGYKNAKVGKVIAVVKDVNELKELMNIVNGEILAVITLSALDLGAIGGVKVFDLRDISELAKLVRDDALNEILNVLPRTDCGMCSFGSCLSLANAVLRGEALLSDCPVLSDVSVIIDGKPLPLKPFVKSVVKALSTSLLSVLKGVPKDYREVVIRLRRDVKGREG